MDSITFTSLELFELLSLVSLGSVGLTYLWAYICHRHEERKKMIEACYPHDFYIIETMGYKVRMCRRCPHQEPVREDEK